MWNIKGNPKKVFGGSEQEQDLARLMIAVNVLDTLRRQMYTLGDNKACGESVDRGDWQVLFLLVSGATGECLHIYRACESLIRQLAAKFEEPATNELDLLSSACAKDGDFFSKVAKRVRDQMGFHWPREIVSAVVASFGDQSLTLMSCELGADAQEHTRLTLGDDIMAAALSRSGTWLKEDAKQASDDIDEINRVGAALVSVLERAIATKMLNSGAVLEKK